MWHRKNLLDEHNLSNFQFSSYLKTPPVIIRGYQYMFSIISFFINLPFELYFLSRLQIYLHYIQRYASLETPSHVSQEETEITSQTESNESNPVIDSGITANKSSSEKIISWNLQFCNGIFEINTLDSIIEYLQKEKPSICTLQEVLRCSKVNQAYELQKELGMKYQIFTPNFKYSDTELGSLILSQYPMDIIKLHDYYQIVKITELSQNLYLFNIHLPSDVTCMSQKKVIAELLVEIEKIFQTEKNIIASTHSDSISDNTNHRIVMCGDFNLLPWCQELQKISELLTPVSNTEYTFPSNYPLVKYDYMFTHELSYNFSVGKVNCSDHLPLLLELNEP